MRYYRNPSDEFLQNLLTRIQLADAQAVSEFLELNPHAQVLYETHKKLLRSLYSEDGISNITLSGIYDLTRLLYGRDAANFLNQYVKGNENFYLDDDGFPAVCQKLNIKYHCSVCKQEIPDPEDILFCNLCDQFFCSIRFCRAPILAAGQPVPDRYRDTECRLCWQKINSGRRF